MSSHTARQNIRTVAELERDFESQRTRSEAIADGIAAFVGSLPFVIVHLLAFVAWVLVNSGRTLIASFDPFPFVLLTLAVSFEGVILATFVLMKQNRMGRAADRRAHLNLQIDLLAEQEVTKILQFQLLLCRKLGIEEPFHDDEVHDMSQHTAVSQLADELTRKLTP